MIKIYDINDKLLMQAEVTSAAKREQEMSKSDYISLSFSAAEKVILPVGAYINYTYKIDKVREVTRQFLLLESYEPTQTDECSWKYTPQFQHPKMELSKKPFFIYTRNSQNVKVKQSVWSFVGTTSVIAEKIKEFLNEDIKFGNRGWNVIFQNVTANTINVSFSDNDFISALTAITNAIGDNCEHHIDYDNEIIYIGKVSIGATPVVLEVGKNVGVPSINESKEGYYNAFSIFGGTRNITQVNNRGENVSSADIRLQLDKGNGTILIDGKEYSYSIDEYSTLDLRADKIKEPLFTKVLNFSQIFPSLNTYVYNVRGRVKYVLDENNEKIPISYNTDGSVKEYKTFTVWYMRLAYPTTEEITGKTIINTTVDDGVTHYWYDFEATDDLLINGKNIGCSFEPNFNTGALSTPLAGRGTNGDYVGFELTYHKEASSSHSSDDVSDSNFSVLAGDYEIIYQEDNEVIIPTNAAEMLIPRGESMPSLKCNITVLYNIAMADTIYYEDAQNRLLEKAKEEIVRLLSDMNNYEVKSYPDVFLEDNPQLQIGQNVTYKYGHGYELATRVLKLSTNIDFGFIQTITLGNQVIKGTITQLKEDVQTIIASGGSSGNGGGYSVSQLRNLIAKYGSDNFLSKQFDDIAKGLITFIKGLVSEALVKLNGGAYFGKGGALIDEAGRAILESLQSIDYDNAAEQGFSVEKEKNGKYHAFLNNLTIWGKAIFHELDVRKLSYSGGNIYLSGAGSKLIKVVPVKESVSADGVISWVETTEDDAECAGWKCYLLADNGTTATMNYWQEGDQVRCQTIGEIVAGGAYSDTSNKSYWRTILDGGVSTQNEKIYGTKTETYLDEAGKEQTREVQVELYDGQAFAWIVVGKHSEGLDGYTEKNAPVEIKGDPAEGDTIVLDGNRHRNGNLEYDKTDRQNVIILETTGDYAPRIACYANISEYKHTITKSVNGENKEVSLSVFETSPKGGTKINSSHFELISDDGSTINIINYRGDWVEGNTYHKNDQVNHNNAVWVCVANSEEDVTGEPSDGSTQWKKVLSGSKGEKGEQGIKGDKGEDGAKGTDGEDAISILVEDAPLVFDTDDNGTVPVSVTKTAKVKVMKGNTNVTNDCTWESSRDDLSSNCMSDVKKDEDNKCINVSIQGGWIVKNDVIVDGVNQGQVSTTSGYAVAQFVYAGVVYFTQVPFSVNVAKYMGSVKVTAKQYQSQFKALENDLKGSNPTVLKAYTSTIKQAAREISLSVSEKSIGRRNLLVGSAFNRQEGFGLNRDANIRGYGILMNDGVDGMNCIKVTSYYDTNRYQYCGAFWGGSYTKNIRIKHGTQYTFSCWVKVDEADTIVYLGVIYNRAEIGQDRDGRPTGAYAFAIKEPNKWQLVKWSFTTDDTHNWIEANVFTCSDVAYKTFVARFCKPMLEEGDYNGWTLSQEDYDYVGGNLLEDTMALTRSSDKSNLQLASGLIMFEKYEGCYGILYNKNNSAESQFTEALQYKFPTTATLSGQARIVKNQDYVFSFVAKGSGNINVYLYGDSVHANVYTETCEGNEYTDGRADGYAQLALTSTYKRYWVHWRIEDYTGEGAEVIPDKVLIRVPGDTEALVTKPKLEEGAQLTDYTERKTDLIDRATAKAAGLEITSSGITLYGEKIKVENTLSTGQTTTAALFTDGAINAALILAQMLTSQGHNGQMVRIADGLINIYGKAGTANIRFGLNSSGQAVLSYYDDNGNFLYDLGPAGIASLSKTDAKITSAQYIKAEDAGLTTPLGENVDLPWVDTTKSWYTATKDNNYILFVKGATGKTTTLYRYSAPRVNGKIVADSANGLGTYDLASAADGRTFTSRIMVKNGALTNLADGVFLTADATVYDNTKLVPSIKKGQSVTRPSFYVQIATFSAKYMTLAGHGRIYSIQTETTFGNLDVGIMSNNNY